MSDHNHLEPEWEFTTECDVRDEPASIRADHVTLLSNLGLLDSWNQTSPSLNSGDLSLDDYFPDIFFQTSLPAITSTTSSIRQHEHPTRVLEYGDSSMSKRIKVVDEIPQLVRTQSQDIEGGRPRESEREQLEHTRPKRTRSSEIHNITERRRRSRINEKIQALGYLIPNFKKTDKASILDEAIVYIKALKLQAEMMSMGRGRLYMSPAGYQQLPYFSPYLPLRPGLHGVGVGFEMGYPMFPLSSATFHPSVLPPAATSFPPIPGSAALPISQAQIPSQLPETFAGSISLPASVSGRANAFKQPYQFGESSSQNIHRLLSTNSQSLPIISQDSTQFGTSNTVPATHIIPPPNVRDILAAEAPQYEEEAGNGKSG